MQRTEFCVDYLINSSEIEFGDSDDIFREVPADRSKSPYNPEVKTLTLVWKLAECSAKFIESIRRDGIRNPVAMINGIITDGHHRIAAAQFLGIKVPVVIYNDWNEFDDNHLWEVRGTYHSDGLRCEESL